MAEVMNPPPESSSARRNSLSASPPPAPRRRGGDHRDYRESSRREYRRNRSPPPPLPRERGRDYKRRISASPPPPHVYRDRRHSPPPHSRRSPPYKRRRDDGVGYDGRRGSPRGGHGRYGYDHPGKYEREMGSRSGYADERPFNRHMSRPVGYQEWDSGRGGLNDASNSNGAQREGLMSYKQFIQELEDDVSPAEAERRYQEYKSEYISTQKRSFFEAHKEEEWLRNKYHPTNLLTVIERRNELAQKTANDFLLDLQSGTLDLGPGVNGSSSNKSGQSDMNSDDEMDPSVKRRRHAWGSAKETDLLSSAPKAHPISCEPRRIQADISQAQALVRKLDSEKGIEENILCDSEGDRVKEKTHGSSTGPVIIIRGLTSVKGLEGTELLDTLITYLWRIHGVDYYGMVETSEAKGLRHVRPEGKGSDVNVNGADWEKKLDSCWQERLQGQDLMEIMTAKEKIDSTAIEGLDPYVRKIRDEKHGWKYGCGAKGCTKLFHAAEFVHKHLKLKHSDLVMELTSKVREELYFQNYMNDAEAPGGQPVMQQPRDRPQRRRLAPERGMYRERPNERYNRSENLHSGDFPSNNETDGCDLGEPRYDGFAGQGVCVGPAFPSDMPPPSVLMPVPGAGPLGPFVPAPPEVAMQMLREQGGPPPFEGGGRPGPQLGGAAPIIAAPAGLRQDPRRIRSYQDLDAPEDEVTVIDYRSL